MHLIRIPTAVVAVGLLASCGSSTSDGNIPQLTTTSATSRQVVSDQAVGAQSVGAPAVAAQALGERAVDKESGAATSATPATVFPGEVDAGPGFSDASPHQLVRTSRNIVYVSVPACAWYPNCYENSLKMQAGNKAGNPTSYSEKDAAHHPQSPSAHDAIGSSAMAIDGNDVIYVAYNTRNFGTHAITFDTKTDRWGKDVTIDSTSAGGSDVSQGREGVGMAVDRAGVPHAVFNFVGSGNVKHIALSVLRGGVWSRPIQIDDASLSSGKGALHPAIAYTPSNELLVAWLVGNEHVSYNNPDGSIRVRELTSDTSGPPSVAIPDTNYQGHPGYAATTIDQGPSIIVTGGGTAEITYIDTADYIRYWTSGRNDYHTWNGDHQPPRQQTHDPSLGPDGNGGLYIYGHGTPQGTQNGHGNYMYRMHLPGGTTTWSSFVEQISDKSVDCSVTTRWAQFFNYDSQQVDYAYWKDEYPNEEFVTNR